MGLRVIGGIFGGRRLAAPRTRATRPSADRVREGLASALAARGVLHGAQVLDLFAGSGALGFEALSRGAERLVAVDDDRRALACIGANAAALGVTERTRTLELDLLARPATAATKLCATGLGPFSLVFVDAPYAELAAVPALLVELAARGLFLHGALVAVEQPVKAAIDWPPALVPLASYRYGDTGIVLLEVVAPDAPAPG